MIGPGPEFGSLFTSFEHTAFRLETLDSYRSANESDALRQFVAGESVDMGWFESWLTMIREASAAGRRFARVRIVSTPLSDYSRFGLYCSAYTTVAGEDIRYLARDHASGLPDYDFWLFDSSRLLRMHFDDGTFVGGEIVDDAVAIVNHNYWRDAARHRASGREDFAGETDVRRDDCP